MIFLSLPPDASRFPLLGQASIQRVQITEVRIQIMKRKDAREAYRIESRGNNYFYLFLVSQAVLASSVSVFSSLLQGRWVYYGHIWGIAKALQRLYSIYSGPGYLNQRNKVTNKALYNNNEAGCSKNFSRRIRHKIH